MYSDDDFIMFLDHVLFCLKTGCSDVVQLVCNQKTKILALVVKKVTLVLISILVSRHAL